MKLPNQGRQFFLYFTGEEAGIERLRNVSKLLKIISVRVLSKRYRVNKDVKGICFK